MTIVPTVRGPVDSAGLGTVLMHEHVFVLSPEFQINFPHHAGFDAEAEIPVAAARLEELVSAGVDTIVDLTVVGLGRDVELIRRVNELTSLQIVVATGLYTFNELPMYLQSRAASGDVVDVMATLFVHDIEEGIAHTGVRAGILKCATDVPGVTRDVERVLRAVARAHRATGAPISTHTHAGRRRGLDQQDVFAAEGVDLSRVVIGHSGDTTDLVYLEELIQRGSYLGMDRFGVETILGFQDRVDTVAALCARGLADRLVLSHDTMCFLDWRDPGQRVAPRYCHISHDVLPALRSAGVSEDDLTTMLVDNPRRIFERGGAY